MRASGWTRKFSAIATGAIALALMALAACSQTAEPPLQVSAVTDAAGTRVGDSAGDGGASLGEFCQGQAAKLRLGAKLHQPAAVSSSELIMDCCEGVFLNFHAAELPTGRLDAMIRGMGGMIASGDHDLAKLPPGLEVRLSNDATALGSGLAVQLSGSVRVDSGASFSDPYQVSLCAEVAAPGQPLDGLRLYVQAFPVARWGWHGRFALRLLADPKVTAQAALQQPLASLALDPEPLLGLSHVGWYTQGHTLRWGMLTGSQALLKRVGPVGTQGVPFVVEADGQRVYLGAFYSLVSSQSFAGPVVMVEQIDDSGFSIAPAYAAQPGAADVRADPRIFKVLGEAGKLVP